MKSYLKYIVQQYIQTMYTYIHIDVYISCEAKLGAMYIEVFLYVLRQAKRRAMYMYTSGHIHYVRGQTR